MASQNDDCPRGWRGQSSEGGRPGGGYFVAASESLVLAELLVSGAASSAGGAVSPGGTTRSGAWGCSASGISGLLSDASSLSSRIFVLASLRLSVGISSPPW